MKNNVEKDIKKYVKKQSGAYSSGLVEELRKFDSEHYEMVELEFSFGKRRCYRKKKQETYELLQGSRGGSCPLEGDKNYSDNIEELLQETIEEIEKPNYRDDVRIAELEKLSESNDVEYFDLKFIKSFSELGFRVPRLMKYYQEQGCETSGYDVLDLNVATGKYLGYNVEKYDFDDCGKKLILDADLVACYHMLEHVTDPSVAVEKIFESMKPGTFFHVEVPIEPEGPNIRYCHMFPFHPRDLGHILSEAGYKVLSFSNETHEGGQWIERYLAMKPVDGA
jgi:SAM-dependent methyltransferase